MIKIYNRETKQYDIEDIAGKKYLEWCYNSTLGENITNIFIKKKLFTKFYGSYCNTKLSQKKIFSYIDDFNVDMSISQKQASDFKNFNEFFIRKLTPEARPIPSETNILMSPGDGRLTAFTNIDINKLVQIKDITYSLKELLGDDPIADKYANGVCIILRLCPLDYHRFHFVDSGVCSETHKIPGHYYSVNPIALEKIQKLFCQNKREWSIFKSENFDDILHVEVGATCVGTILQTYTPNIHVSKGDEKGYFKFGGSTTILFFKKDTISIDADILEQSNLGFETRVLIGERIGKRDI